MYRVVKRDGRIVDFEISKIANAMKKAFDATETNYNQSVIDFLAVMVTADFQPKITDELIHIEDIQDSVESVLSRGGYENVAKAYILYRKQHENLRAVSDTVLDYKKTVDNYLKINDWRVKENSTVTYSVGGLILSNSGAITANYWLSEVYDEEIANAHRNGDLHLHDLSMLTGYCAGWSLRQLIQEGLGGVPGKYAALDIGPCGRVLQPAGDLPFDEAVEVFAEVVRAGTAAGADFILLETFTDLYELKAAVIAAKENSDLPIFATMSFEANGTTFFGASVESMVMTLEALGVAALGVNCSLGPKQLAPVVKRILAATRLPVLVQPNAGLPVMEGGATRYDITPEEVAFLKEEIAAYDMVMLQLEIPMEINELVAKYAYEQGVPVMLNSAPSAPLSAELLSHLSYTPIWA